MSIVEKITQSRSKATKEIHKFARAEAEGKSVDADKATAALNAAGITEADYGELVSFFEHVIKLEREAAKRDQASKAHGEAKAALEEHQAETERIKEQRAEQFATLMKDHQEKEAAARKAKQAESELAALRFRHPERFGAERVENLDSYTLTHGPNVIGCRDERAPVLEVDGATFRRESERRGKIMSAAREAVNGARRNLPLSWGALVEHGHVRELER